jgi:hypothetical protein
MAPAMVGHALGLSDRREHPFVGLAAHAVRAVAGLARPAAAYHAAGAARHPAPGRPRHIAGGFAQSLQPGLALAGWAVALLAALPLGWAIGSRRAVRLRSEDGRLEVAGGWFVLGFAVSIFVVRYTLGVLSGVMPHLRAEPLWIVLSGGVGGAVTGIGVGWLVNLLLRAYRPVMLRG